ncbi:LysR family transcriptional regulator [Rhizobium oryziradicis]|uniref:HTH-type transcriptional regulator TtuA n=1 Tax=Rhizobium oryziradicis TaxID=1867956 RepID=A0A1Q8ZSA1_9HYPH|nr:LysR family transcriptional regulator [Rhizobium oryziradicis]OLP44957.1 LysR family transcriptional regulator [Rhizobium oryziradicis]
MISELKTLVAVSRFGTFSAAGDRIGLTQAAVSGQIKRLEDHIGVALFARTGRSAVMNAEGLRVLEQAKAIISMFEALTRAGEGDLVGSLKIGTIASVQSTLLARALVSFRSRFARHHLHIAPGISLNLFDQVDAGELDLAVVIKPSHGVPKELSWTPLVQEPYELAIRAELDSRDWMSILRQQPFIRYERTSFGGRQVDRFLKSQSLAVQDSMELDDLQAILALVGKGLGVAILPITESNMPLPLGVQTIPLGDHRLIREIGIVSKMQTDEAINTLKLCLVEACR